MDPSSLELFFLGSPIIKLNGQPIEIHLAKAKALLAFLALSVQRQRREMLATFFWPDHSQERAHSYLRNALWLLKTSLGPDWFVITREDIGLKPGPSVWLDVIAYRQNLNKVEIHRQQHPADNLCQVCATSLEEAVSFYRDDFMAGFTLPDSPTFDRWQEFNTAELHQEHCRTLDILTHWHLDQGNFADATNLARHWVVMDPLEETARRSLIKAYICAGQRTAAFQQYQEFVQTLKHELNIAPSIDMIKFFQSLIAGSLSAIDPIKSSMAQEEIATLPMRSASSSNTAGGLMELPLAFVSPVIRAAKTLFVNLDYPLLLLQKHLDASIQGYGRVVFITGEPGMGKTTLAQEFARRAQESCTDLIVSGGNCQPPFRQNKPYEVFDEVMGLMAGEIEQRWAGGLLTAVNIDRLFSFFPAFLEILVHYAPDLITSFLSDVKLSTKTWVYDRPDLFSTTLPVKIFALDFRSEKNGNLKQDQIIDQFTLLLQKISSLRPLLLILDDFHWADLSSVRLLVNLYKQIGNNRILILCLIRTRASEIELHEGMSLPFNRFYQQYYLLNSDQWIDLDQVIREEGSKFVNAWLEKIPNRFDTGLRQALYEFTLGQPLLLVETFQEMAEINAITLDMKGCWSERKSVYDTFQIRNALNQPPKLVEKLIERRVERLPKDIRKIYEIASIEGEIFGLEVLARILNLDWVKLVQYFIRDQNFYPIARPLSLYQSRPYHISWFRFSHNLIQKYLYDHIELSDRAQLHRAVGLSLEQMYVDQAEQICGELAWHFEKAGETEKSVQYRRMYSRRAIRLREDSEADQIIQKSPGLAKKRPKK